jgi:hypothetical protein
MTFERWLPRTDHSRPEEVLRRRSSAPEAVWLLRDCRRELFSDDFQAEWSRCIATPALGGIRCRQRSSGARSRAERISGQGRGHQLLIEQIDALDAWLRDKLPEEMSRPPLKEHVETLAQIRAQNLEPDRPAVNERDSSKDATRG